MLSFLKTDFTYSFWLNDNRPWNEKLVVTFFPSGAHFQTNRNKNKTLARQRLPWRLVKSSFEREFDKFLFKLKIRFKKFLVLVVQRTE